MYITESQIKAYQIKIVDRWEGQHQTLPEDYITIADNDPRGYAIGIWGGPAEKRRMYFGIEVDGYTHT